MPPASSASAGIRQSRDTPRFVSREQVVTQTMSEDPSGEGTGEDTLGSAHKSSGVIGAFVLAPPACAESACFFPDARPECGAAACFSLEVPRERAESALSERARRGFFVCIESPWVHLPTTTGKEQGERITRRCVRFAGYPIARREAACPAFSFV